jgi:hypothetical protein
LICYRGKAEMHRKRVRHFHQSAAFARALFFFGLPRMSGIPLRGEGPRPVGTGRASGTQNGAHVDSATPPNRPKPGFTPPLITRSVRWAARCSPPPTTIRLTAAPSPAARPRRKIPPAAPILPSCSCRPTASAMPSSCRKFSSPEGWIKPV